MTHEELIANINKDIDEVAIVKGYWPVRNLQALRSVVELHSPSINAVVYCLCGEKHPCPTIQAIEEWWD